MGRRDYMVTSEFPFGIEVGKNKYVGSGNRIVWNLR